MVWALTVNHGGQDANRGRITSLPVECAGGQRKVSLFTATPHLVPAGLSWSLSSLCRFRCPSPESRVFEIVCLRTGPMSGCHLSFSPLILLSRILQGHFASPSLSGDNPQLLGLDTAQQGLRSRAEPLCATVPSMAFQADSTTSRLTREEARGLIACGGGCARNTWAVPHRGELLGTPDFPSHQMNILSDRFD